MVDEAGQEGREDVIIAGYVGSDASWENLVTEWRAAIAPRKSLQGTFFEPLRWNGRPDPLSSLAKLGPIPDQCGLQRIIGHVRVADYADLFTEDQLRKLVPGYQMALHALTNSCAEMDPQARAGQVLLRAAGRICTSTACGAYRLLSNAAASIWITAKASSQAGQPCLKVLTLSRQMLYRTRFYNMPETRGLRGLKSALHLWVIGGV